MKKLLLIILALALIFAFAACGSPQPATDDTGDSENPIVDSDLMSDQYAQLMKSGTYYMESTTYGMAGTPVTTVSAVDGENSDNRTTVDGMTTRVLVLDGTLYSIDEASKTYYTIAIDPDDIAAAAEIDYANMTYIGKGNDVIPGFSSVDSGSYDYEEYQVTVNAGGEALIMPLRYYFKDGALYAIYMSLMDSDTIMQITTISDEIPAGMLTMPEGYTEVALPSY